MSIADELRAGAGKLGFFAPDKAKRLLEIANTIERAEDTMRAVAMRGDVPGAARTLCREAADTLRGV